MPIGKDQTAKVISFKQFEELCDDPARDIEPHGLNVRAILQFEPDKGFYLYALDGQTLYQIHNDRQRPLKYRTIEAAMKSLQSVSGLSQEIGLRLPRPSGAAAKPSGQ